MWQTIKNLFSQRNNSQPRRRIPNNQQTPIKKELASNIDYLKNKLAASDDLVYKELFIGADTEFAAQLVYIDGMINKDYLQNQILEPLMFDIQLTSQHTNLKHQLNNTLSQLSIPLASIETAASLEAAIESLLAGNVLLFIDNVAEAFVLDIRQEEGRSIGTPTLEQTTRGSQEAFTESIATNISLIRKRLRDNNLLVKIDKIGDRTNTDLGLLYIEDVADEDVVKEIENRLEKIDLDGILDIGYIEQYLADKPLSPFPVFDSTERPDTAVSNLLEGKIVLILDGSPFATIMPTTFIQFFQSPEDYYDVFYMGGFLRILRLVAAFLSITLPSLYVALVAFRHELLPRDLAMSIAQARQGVPFPSYLEALIMELSLELLREAGLRLPGPIGQTIGIVGGIILGEAAVNAGLVSGPMVIVVAVTAISSFVIPSYSAAIPLRLIRLPMMVLAASFSIYGIMIGWLIILIHLCDLESLGHPYFAPFAPLKWSDLKDSLLRFPLRLMGQRPTSTSTQQQDRQDREGDQQ